MRLFAAILEEVVGWTKVKITKKKKSPLDKGRIAAWNTSGPKKNKKYAIDLKDRKREEKIKKTLEPIDFKECGCLPDCGCKE